MVGYVLWLGSGLIGEADRGVPGLISTGALGHT